MSTHFKNKAAPARIMAGKISAQHAASRAGVKHLEIVRLCREKTIVLLARPHSPIQRPEIYARGGIL